MAGDLPLNSQAGAGDVPQKVQLIAIMGATGSGKSSFVNHILAPNSEKAEVGHDLESCTSEVKAMTFELNGYNGSIIDTPGFDDSTLTDTDILKRISAWMEVTYRQGVKITGIIYLRDITEPRMKGSSIKNLAMFRKLCGTDSLANVVFVTTKWDLAPTEEAEQREAQFETKYLSTELGSGAQMARHNNTTKSAVEVLTKILGNQGIALKLQKQLVNEGRELKDTDAGAAVGADIEKLREEHATELEEVKTLLQEESTKANAALKKDLEEKQAETEKKLRKLEADKKALEMDRAREMLEYRNRLQEAACLTEQTTSDVLMQGLTTGMLQVGPLIFKEWQDWKAEAARERAEERAIEDEKMRRNEEWEREKYERANADEKQRLDVEKQRLDLERETARKLEVASLRQELEEQKRLQQQQQSSQAASTSIPIIDLFSLPIEIRAAGLKKVIEKLDNCGGDKPEGSKAE